MSCDDGDTRERHLLQLTVAKRNYLVEWKSFLNKVANSDTLGFPCLERPAWIMFLVETNLNVIKFLFDMCSISNFSWWKGLGLGLGLRRFQAGLSKLENPSGSLFATFRAPHRLLREQHHTTLNVNHSKPPVGPHPTIIRVRNILLI
jgi:hypothetical protein